MKKPVIVCDIDDVVFPFVPGMAEHYNAKFGASLTVDDFFSFDFSEVWGNTEAEAMALVEEFLSSYTVDLAPLPGVIEAFKRLSKDFDIVMVTARNGIFEDSTTQWLRAHLPDLFSHAIFAGNRHDGRGYRSKGEICKELGALLIIDDHPSNIASAIEQGVDGILFGEKKWTLDGVAQNPSVKHCVDWEEVLEYIYGQWRTKQLS